jgi:hypothetical protein
MDLVEYSNITSYLGARSVTIVLSIERSSIHFAQHVIRRYLPFLRLALKS